MGVEAELLDTRLQQTVLLDGVLIVALRRRCVGHGLLERQLALLQLYCEKNNSPSHHNLTFGLGQAAEYVTV